MGLTKCVEHTLACDRPDCGSEEVFYGMKTKEVRVAAFGSGWRRVGKTWNCPSCLSHDQLDEELEGVLSRAAQRKLRDKSEVSVALKDLKS